MRRPVALVPHLVLALVAVLAILAGVAVPAHADEALVLSGGGARGLAHVGVVVGVDESGHDPGLVVGTSMGSIVGGLYAAGYSGAAIDSIVEREDWRTIFTPFPFEVGPSRGLRYPLLRLDTSGRTPFGSRGYVPDWKINLRLLQLLFDASARARGDFDRLPRRFRSITADAETGELVVLGTGNLARAVRGSMAAAGFFAPVRLGDQLLTDGGIADYLPVAVAARLGGGPIIAADVLKPPPHLQDFDALSVARRSIEIVTIRARLDPIAPDILIRPGVDPGLAPFAYPIDPSPVIREGYTATLAALDGWATPKRMAPRSLHILPPPPESIGQVLVEDSGSSQGPRSDLNAFLRRAFDGVAPGPYRADRILDRVERLYATGLFDGVWTSVEDSAGLSAPILKVRAESKGPASMAGALGYDNDRGGRAWASLRRLDTVGAFPVEAALEGGANGAETWACFSARLTTLAFGASAWTTGIHYGEREARFAGVREGDLAVTRFGSWLGFETRRLRPAIHGSLGFRADDVRSDFGPDGGSYGPWIRIEGVTPLLQVVGVTPAVEAEARFGDVEYRMARVQGSVSDRLGGVAIALTADGAAVSHEAPLDVAPNMGGESGIPGLREGERHGRARFVGGVDAAAAAPFHSTLRVRARGGVIADETRAARGILYSHESLWLGGVRVSSLWWTPFGRIEVAGEGSTLGDRRVVVGLGAEF